MYFILQYRLECLILECFVFVQEEQDPENEEDIDGAPLSDVDGEAAEDLDGVPLDGATLLKGALKLGIAPQATSAYDDIDGIPSTCS